MANLLLEILYLCLCDFQCCPGAREKGRYRYAGQWKHGRMHGCGVYEVNERTTFVRPHYCYCFFLTCMIVFILFSIDHLVRKVFLWYFFIPHWFLMWCCWLINLVNPVYAMTMISNWRDNWLIFSNIKDVNIPKLLSELSGSIWQGSD